MPDPTWNLFNGSYQSYQSVFLGSYANAVEDGRNCVKIWGPDSYVGGSVTYTDDATFEFVAKLVPEAGTYTGTVLCAMIAYTRDSNRVESDWWFQKRSPHAPANIFSDIAVATTLRRRAIADILEGGWHTFRIVIKSKIPYVFLDGYFYGTPAAAGSISASFTTNIFTIATVETGKTITIYVDTFKASSTAKEPDVSGLRMEGESIVTRPTQPTPYDAYFPPETKVRIRKGNSLAGFSSYGPELVATDNALASKVRIYDGSAVKALQKYPTF